MKSVKPLPKGLDVESVSAALRRAAKRAHFIAYQHGEGVVINKNGKTVIVPPDPEMYGELLAEVEEKRAAVIAEYGAAYGEDDKRA
ncbi:MAG: hypothetical protein MPK05_04110 [Gammaproteobacteria bacterium]|nr:hypothetical protein [Gammaproteobacteria bacterium]